MEGSEMNKDQFGPSFDWYKGIVTCGPVDNSDKNHTGDYYFIHLGESYYIDLSLFEYDGDISKLEGEYVNIYGKFRCRNKDISDFQGTEGIYLMVNKIEIIELPMKIIYNDWNNNTYEISEAQLKYTPIKPFESSSGIYDGGLPFIRGLEKYEYRDVFIIIEDLYRRPDLILEFHIKPSAFIKTWFKEKEKSAIIRYCEELLAFHNHVEQLLYN